MLAFALVRGGHSKVSLVSSDGSGRRVVPGTSGAILALFSPDGQSLTFTRFRRENLSTPDEFESSSIWIVDLLTSERRQLTPWRDGLDYIASSYSPDGSTLLATRIDERLSQEPEPVALHLDGTDPALILDEGSFPVYSPDGSRIALFRQHERVTARKGQTRTIDTTSDLYVVNSDGSGLRRLTHTPKRDEIFASWDPSGERLAYLRLHAGHSESASAGFGDSIMQINVDGTCPTEILSAPHTAFYGPAWQPGAGREAGRIAC